MKILVTPRSFASTSKEPLKILQQKNYQLDLNETGERYTEAKMKKLIEDVDGVIVGTDPLTSEVLQEAQQLKIISKYGVGVDNIDLDFARQNNIAVTNTPDANSRSVAELTICYLFALSRRIVEADKKTKNYYQGKIIGNTLNKKVLGILGLGKIGRQVARLAQGLNLQLIAYDIERDHDFARKHDIEFVEFTELLERSDYICCNVPLNSATRNMIAKEEIDKIKENAFLINTARSEVINEDYLITALKNGKLAGAALDVQTQETIDKINQQSDIKDKIILTPHMGAHTEEAIEKMGVQAAQNLVDYFNNKELQYRVV